MRYLYKSESISIPQRLLFIPLKETVIFPYVVAPLFFQSDEALAILNKVLFENSLIGRVGLRDPYLKDTQPKDLLSVGTVCKILQLVKLPNRGMKILVEGLSRVFSKILLGNSLISKQMSMRSTNIKKGPSSLKPLSRALGPFLKFPSPWGSPFPKRY